MDLSILIATVPPRKNYLNRLLTSLQNQIVNNNLQDLIEIVIYKDNFEKSLGEKRNFLIENSLGKYVVFIDDDDMVSDDYCKDIFEVIRTKDVDQISITKRWFEKDKSLPIKISKNFGFYSVIFFKNLHLEESIENKNFILKLKIGDNTMLSNKNFLSSFFMYFLFFLSKKFVTSCVTYTHPMTPIKKEIVNKIKFSNRPKSQDVEWICKMYKNKLIKSEHIIDKELYYYYFDKNVSIKRDKNNLPKFGDDLDWELREIDKINIKWL
jgi:hypothetical protein